MSAPRPQAVPDEVSVIVPALDAMPFLREALASVRGQSLPPSEILVVDGGSTDGSRELATATPRVRLLDQRSRGLAAARNEGLAAAHGEWIAFLDADDLWLPGHLGTAMEYFAAHPDCEGVLAQMMRFLEPGKSSPSGYADGWLDRPVPGFTPGALVARRALFARVGSFDPELRIAADSDWFARAADRGARIDPLPRVGLRKRIHGDNLSTQVEAYRKELLRVARRAFERRVRSPREPDAC